MTTEEWRAIRDWPYAVSNLGNVKRTGKAYGATVGHVLKGRLSTVGYLRVSLRKNGEGCDAHIHTLVAEAFVGPRPENWQINHKDGDKLNNNATNLEYLTRADNMRHAFRAGIFRPAWLGKADCIRNRLSVDDFRQVFAMLAEGISHAVIGSRFSISEATVARIRDGYYADITDGLCAEASLSMVPEPARREVLGLDA